MTRDIKNFYLNTPMDRFEYMQLKLADLPDDVIKQYNLEDRVAPYGWVYLEMRNGLYGLPQAGILAHKLLEKTLNKKGYVKLKLTPGLWPHKWHPIFFTLFATAAAISKNPERCQRGDAARASATATSNVPSNPHGHLV